MPEFTGTLRYRFTLLRPADTSGSPVYSPVRVVPGSLEGTGANDFPALQASADYRCQIRFTEDLTIRDQLQLGTRLFVIKSLVDPDGRRQRLDLLLQEQI